MRCLFAIVAISGLVTIAGPAFAQPRDPFIPLIRPADTAGVTTSSETDGTTTAPTAEVAPAREGLPVTGRGVTEWLVLAYVLIAAGAAAAFYGWSTRPARLRRSFR